MSQSPNDNSDNRQQKSIPSPSSQISPTSQTSQSSSSLSQELTGEKRFELKRHIADTLQGRIYGAIDHLNNKYVVVKETWKQLIQLKKSRDGHNVPEDFIKEKKIMLYLSKQQNCDAGFVRIIDEWEDGNCYFYAMEGCQGGELFEFVKSMHTKEMAQFTQSQMNLPQVVMDKPNDWIKIVRHMFKQLARCVSWMHSKDVCHLDLSLENTMIYDKSTHTIKIIDFGLAMYAQNGNFSNNQRVGKTGYMAPEVFAKKQYDARKADIWSLGVMLFMMLIGAPPYDTPMMNNPAFSYIMNGRLSDVLKHWKRLRHVTDHALDLMVKIFKFENQRISMEELLKHPFLQSDETKILASTSNVASQEQVDNKNNSENVNNNNLNTNINTNTNSNVNNNKNQDNNTNQNGSQQNQNNENKNQNNSNSNENHEEPITDQNHQKNRGNEYDGKCENSLPNGDSQNNGSSNKNNDQNQQQTITRMEDFVFRTTAAKRLQQSVIAIDSDNTQDRNVAYSQCSRAIEESHRQYVGRQQTAGQHQHDNQIQQERVTEETLDDIILAIREIEIIQEYVANQIKKQKEANKN